MTRQLLKQKDDNLDVRITVRITPEQFAFLENHPRLNKSEAVRLALEAYIGSFDEEQYRNKL